jgi:hypothetical protein
MAQAGQQRLQKQAAKYSDKLTAQGHGATYQPPSDNWEDKYKALQTDPGVSSYAKNLAAGWAKNGPELIKNTPAQAPVAPVKTTPKKPATTAKPATGAGAFGQMANQLSTTGASSTGGKTQATPIGLRHTANPNNPNNPPNNPNSPPPPATAKPRASFGKVPSASASTKPGQMPASVANSAQGKKMQQAYGKPKGGIQGMESDIEEAVAPAQAPAAPSANQDKAAFIKWSDGQLATRVPETGATITMDKVREVPELNTRLSAALNQVVQSQGTPAQVAAVEAYIQLAVAGVQALAQK